MIRAIIIAHGQLASELLNAALTIVSVQEEVITLSNTELSLEELQNSIKDNVVNPQNTIIFVDCFGSPFTAAKIAGGDIPVISGVNLPMLLSFFTKREYLTMNDLINAVINDGKKGISYK